MSFSKCDICVCNDEYEGCKQGGEKVFAGCILYSKFDLSIEKAKQLAKAHDISLSDLFTILAFMEENNGFS